MLLHDYKLPHVHISYALTNLDMLAAHFSNAQAGVNLVKLLARKGRAAWKLISDMVYLIDFAGSFPNM